MYFVGSPSGQPSSGIQVDGMASQSGCKCLLSQGFVLFSLVPMEMSLCEYILRGCVRLPKNSVPASVISDRGVFVSKIKMSYKTYESVLWRRVVHSQRRGLCYTGIGETLR